MMESSRELENAFKQIITAGWNQRSSGDVEAPTGHFATIPISSVEMPELLDAVFDDEPPEVTIDPGYYFAKEDSDGNMWLWCFSTAYEMNAMYARYEREYNEWAKDKPYLVCECGEVFDEIEAAADHTGHDADGEEYQFTIKLESRAF
jgi:hypothetical protein